MPTQESPFYRKILPIGYPQIKVLYYFFILSSVGQSYIIARACCIKIPICQVQNILQISLGQFRKYRDTYMVVNIYIIVYPQYNIQSHISQGEVENRRQFSKKGSYVTFISSTQCYPDQFKSLSPEKFYSLGNQSTLHFNLLLFQQPAFLLEDYTSILLYLNYLNMAEDEVDRRIPLFQDLSLMDRVHKAVILHLIWSYQNLQSKPIFEMSQRTCLKNLDC